MKLRALIYCGFLAAAVGCGAPAPSTVGGGGSGGAGGGSAEPPPVLTYSSPPPKVGALPAGAKFAEAVPYGADPSQVMDVFLPQSAEPTALVFFFHGGGFQNGSRANVYAAKTVGAISQFLTANIAFITADYRLLEPPGTETEGVRKCLGDIKTAVQMVRRWAEVFNIDPTRIAAYGSSAGAGASLWLAFHDDLANPAAQSSIERESTRLVAAAAVSTQSTYDVLRWAPDVYAPEYPEVTNEGITSDATFRDLLVQFYGLPSSSGASGPGLLAALDTPGMRAYRQDVDMLDLLSGDDPPIFIDNNRAALAPGGPGFELLHRPRHSLTLRAKAQAAGVDVEANITAYDVSSTMNAIDFLIGELSR
ncbi:MAG: carboxylesterase family protein [Bacteroidia bacterium]|nr:carboxylesterase family protein [Bacteroidia bacterium]